MENVKELQNTLKDSKSNLTETIKELEKSTQLSLKKTHQNWAIEFDDVYLFLSTVRNSAKNRSVFYGCGDY